jgi:hypothetical protein
MGDCRQEKQNVRGNETSVPRYIVRTVPFRTFDSSLQWSRPVSRVRASPLHRRSHTADHVQGRELARASAVAGAVETGCRRALINRRPALGTELGQTAVQWGWMHRDANMCEEWCKDLCKGS